MPVSWAARLADEPRDSPNLQAVAAAGRVRARPNPGTPHRPLAARHVPPRRIAARAAATPMSHPNFLLLAAAWCAVGYMLLTCGDSTGAILASMASISAMCLDPGAPG